MSVVGDKSMPEKGGLKKISGKGKKKRRENSQLSVVGDKSMVEKGGLWKMRIKILFLKKITKKKGERTVS